MALTKMVGAYTILRTDFMNNEKMFNVLEKLLDECENFCKQNPTEYNQDLMNYCQKTRGIVFDDKSDLNFAVISKAQLIDIHKNNQIAQEVAIKLDDLFKKVQSIKNDCHGEK